MPIDFPLWYVRDLMIIVLLAPLLYKLIKAGIFAVIVLGIAWLVFDIEILGLEISGFFFFTLGGYLAINKVDMFKGFASKQIVILVLLLTTIVVAIDMITRGTFYHYFIHNISVLMGVATVCISTVCIIKLGKQIRWIDKLAPTTFFVYAMHGLFVATLRKGLCLVFCPATNIGIIGVYTVSIILTIIVCLISYYTLKRCCPRVCLVLNGGR